MRAGFLKINLITYLGKERLIWNNYNHLKIALLKDLFRHFLEVLDTTEFI